MEKTCWSKQKNCDAEFSNQKQKSRLRKIVTIATIITTVIMMTYRRISIERNKNVTWKRNWSYGYP